MSARIPSRAIDWDTAQRIGELIAGSPPYGGPAGRSVQPLAHEFARRVGEYTGLSLPAELPPLEMIDRPAWIAANLLTMRPLLDPLLERLGGEREEPTQDTPGSGDADGGRVGGLVSGPLRSASNSLRSASGHLLGAQLGAVDGHALPAGARPVRHLAARRLRARRACCCSRRTSPRPRATSEWIATS